MPQLALNAVKLELKKAETDGRRGGRLLVGKHYYPGDGSHNGGVIAWKFGQRLIEMGQEVIPDQTQHLGRQVRVGGLRQVLPPDLALGEAHGQERALAARQRIER